MELFSPPPGRIWRAGRRDAADLVSKRVAAAVMNDATVTGDDDLSAELLMQQPQ